MAWITPPTPPTVGRYYCSDTMTIFLSQEEERKELMARVLKEADIIQFDIEALYLYRVTQKWAGLRAGLQARASGRVQYLCLEGH